jgi:hypothetical protein
VRSRVALARARADAGAWLTAGPRRTAVALLGATALLGALAPAAGAHTARGDRGRGPASGVELRQLTGLAPAQTTAEQVCPPAPAGHARCAAQVVVLRSSRRIVHPRVRSGVSGRLLERAGLSARPGAAGATAVPEPAAGSAAYIQQAYDMAYLSSIRGGGDTIAIVDSGLYGNAAADLSSYRSQQGLPACTQANGCLRIVNQQGTGAPLPPEDGAWAVEETIDLDAVSAICPNCRILLVATNSSGLDDLDQGVETAATLGAQQISLSWSTQLGGPPPGTYTFPGVATVAATGDAGYAGPGVDAYPAALPGVTAAGGTTLTPSTTASLNLRGFNESAWALRGGEGDASGCDTAEAKPAYQTDSGCPGRTYSDVSADADPNTGLLVYNSARGGWLLAGGTSLSAPLIAAFYGAAGLEATTPQWAYTDRSLLNDAVGGSTGSCAAALSYVCEAVPGYDGPTGNGSISGDVVAGAPGIGGPAYGSGAQDGYIAAASGDGATLAGGVYANGAPTTVYWQYGTTSAYGQQTPLTAVGSGPAAVPVRAALTGLAPHTVYHYRLVAENRYGASYGYDSTFTSGASAQLASRRIPRLARRAVIRGRLVRGHVLRAVSAWRLARRLSYRWYRSTNGGRSWSRIRHAVRARYRVKTRDSHSEIRVTVIASNTAGRSSSTSSAVGARVRRHR